MPFKFNIYYTLLLVTIRRQWKGKRIVGGYFLNQKRKRIKRNVDKVLYYNAFYIYLGMKIGEGKKKKEAAIMKYLLSCASRQRIFIRTSN